MVSEGSALPSLGTKVENSLQTTLPPYSKAPAHLGRGGGAKGLSGQPS